MPSKFDLLRQQREAQAPVSKFDLLRQQRQAPPQEEDSLGRSLARGTKSAVAGALGSMPDTFVTMPYNALTGGMNAALGTKIQPLPSTTETLDQGIDQLTGGYTATPEHARTAQEGVKAAAGMLTPGGMAQFGGKLLGKAGTKALSFIGGTRPAAVFGAGAAGSAMEAAHQRGDSALSTFGQGLGTGVGAEVLATGLKPQNLARGLTKAVGFGKGNLKQEAVEAAERIGASLPNVAATEGALPHFGYNVINKIPGLGDMLRKDAQASTESYQKAWGKVLDDVGPLKTKKVRALRTAKYEALDPLAGDDTISVLPVFEKIQHVRKKLTSISAGPTKEAMLRKFDQFTKGLNQFMPQEFSELVPESQAVFLKKFPVPVWVVRNEITEIHDFMRSKDLFNGKNEKAKKLLDDILTSVKKTLEDYGESNPAYLEAYKDANAFYTQVAKRETLEGLLRSHLENPQTDTVSWKPLSKVLADSDNQDILKNSLGPEHYEKLKDFTVYTKAMNASAASNQNPSGSTTTGTALVLASQIIHDLWTGNYMRAAGTVGGIGVGTTLLLNKKFLDQAIKFAKEPTERSAEDVLKAITAQTGVSMRELTKSETNDRQKRPAIGQNIPPRPGR